MRQLKVSWIYFSILILLGFFTVSEANNNHVRVRTGMLMAQIGGSLTTNFAVAPIFNAEYEVPTSLKTSQFFMGTLANEMATAQTKYFGIAYGRRSYFGGSTAYSIVATDMETKGDYLSVTSKRKFSWDWHMGIGQMQTYLATFSLNLTATTFDMGSGLNWETSLFGSTALTTRFHMGYSYGISSVAVSGILFGGQIGASF